MKSIQEVLEFVEEGDVNFIKLSFFDIFGNQKNISIPAEELPKAFKEGISFDGSAVMGFNDEVQSDLFLHPDFRTVSILPWRSIDGTVISMYCDIRYPDETPYERDSRYILKQAVKRAKKMGITVQIGSEYEFYLFKLDENGNNTNRPLDNAGYMDIAPEDQGEDVRRQICFTLRDMNIEPEASHHEEGPGQNEIDFRYATALEAADNASTFKWVVKTVAQSNGLYADFSPKPLKHDAGNGMHINLSILSKDGKEYLPNFMAGVMKYVPDMTLFLNTDELSYERLGRKKAPKYVTWSKQNRSQLIRIPATKDGSTRLELRSPDPLCNPYLAYALIIHAGLDGIENNLQPDASVDVNLFQASEEITKGLQQLPNSLKKAYMVAENSEFIAHIIPKNIVESYKK